MLRFLSEASGSDSFNKVDIILSSSVNKHTFTIGRALSSDLVIALPRLSREHCRFVLNNCGKWLIEDISSTGTWVNDNQLPKNVPYILKENDIIKLSEDCLVYQFKSCVGSACVSSNNSPSKSKDIIDKKPLSQLSSKASSKIKENATHDGYVPEAQIKVLVAEESEKRKKLEQSHVADLQAQKEKYEKELDALKMQLQLAEQKEVLFARNEEEWKHEKELLANDIEKRQNQLEEIKAEHAQQLEEEKKQKEEAVLNKLQLVQQKEILFARKQEEWQNEREFLTHNIEKSKNELYEARGEHARQLEEVEQKMSLEIDRLETENLSLQKLVQELNHKLNVKTQELILLTDEHNIQLLTREMMDEDNRLLLEEKKRLELGGKLLKEQLEFSFGEKVKKLESEKQALCKERDDLVQQMDQLQQRLNEAHAAKEVISERQLQAFEELMENELQCAICTEIVVNSQTLVCGHTFCHVCIDTWLVKNPHCPNCRKKIKRTYPSRVLDGFIGRMVDNLSNPFKRKREQIVNEKGEVAACKQFRFSDFHQTPSDYIDLTVTPPHQPLP